MFTIDEEKFNCEFEHACKMIEDYTGEISEGFQREAARLFPMLRTYRKWMAENVAGRKSVGDALLAFQFMLAFMISEAALSECASASGVESPPSSVVNAAVLESLSVIVKMATMMPQGSVSRRGESVVPVS